VIGAEFEDGDPQAAKPVLMANVLVRRDQNVEPVPIGSPEEIAVAQLMPTHLKGEPDFDADENRAGRCDREGPSSQVTHPRRFVAVVEIEHGANRIRGDPAVVFNQPFDPLLPVRKKILWAEPNSLDDGLAAPLSGHGLDQGAFGPINVFHDCSLTR
jgi:hypothetical protein